MAPPSTRRATVNSTPVLTTSLDCGPAAPASPPSYNSVPPPAADDMQAQIQIFKQSAREIASRLLFHAEVGASVGGGGFDAKQARVYSGSGYDPSGGDRMPALDSAPSAIPISYNNDGQGSTMKIEIPDDQAGFIIGEGGETIKSLRDEFAAKVQITRDVDADSHAPEKKTKQ
ncbi:far upstream element-binding protein 1-like [Punica granatum]|nr:far upstream element-binding protein 1-like [Punica granatum]